MIIFQHLLCFFKAFFKVNNVVNLLHDDNLDFTSSSKSWQGKKNKIQPSSRKELLYNQFVLTNMLEGEYNCTISLDVGRITFL